jgi:endonuclease/exonuclease/phosphatase family metal-dependent hydrolase
MGDFNCKPGSAPYKVFVGDNNSDVSDLLNDTIENGKEIDWILYKGNVKVLKYEEVDYNVDGIYPSDHNPIFVEFRILDQ